jgi:tetratricopeptide (TPR) repeat protein
MYEESLAYIEKGLNEKYTNNDVVLEASLKEIKAYNYFSLYLDDQALEEYKSVIYLVSKRTDTESHKILSRIYASIALMYALKNNNTTASYYINKALKHYQKVPVNKFEKFDLSGLYIVKGRICLTDKKTDSAFYYIEKGYDFVKDDKKHSNYKQLSALADFYYTTKQYSKALDYYLKVIDDMEKFKIKNANYLIEIYPTIAELYQKLDDSENQKLFLDKYRKESEQFQK